MASSRSFSGTSCDSSTSVSWQRSKINTSRNAADSAIYQTTYKPGSIIARSETVETPERSTTSSVSIKSRTDSSIRSAKSYIRPYFRSRRIAKSEIEKPWVKERKCDWPTIIPCFGFACGLALMAVMVYLGLDSVPRHRYCLVMEDNFDGPSLNKSLWNQEVQLGGYGQVLFVSFEYDQLTCTGPGSSR